MEEVKTIKRYQNRKLYDTGESTYVTLEDIALMVRAGQDVRIIDNKTGEDLTSVTLTQIIFEEEKKQRNRLPLSSLKEIIKGGGEQISHFIDRNILGDHSPIGRAKVEAEQYIQKLIKKGELTREEASNIIHDIIDNTQRSFEDIQRRIDDSISEVVEKMSLTNPAVTEMRLLKEKLKQLEQKVGMLEEELDETEKRTKRPTKN